MSKRIVSFIRKLCFFLPIILILIFFIDCEIHQVSLWEGCGIISLRIQKINNKSNLDIITEYFRILSQKENSQVIYEYRLDDEYITIISSDDYSEHTKQSIPEDIQKKIKESNIFFISCSVERNNIDISYSISQAGASTLHYNTDIKNNILSKSTNWEKTGVITIDTDWYIMYYKDLVDGW